MEKTLRDKHYAAIFEIDNGTNTSQDKARSDAAKACTQITIDFAKEFAEWCNLNGWAIYTGSENGSYNWSEYNSVETPRKYKTTNTMKFLCLIGLHTMIFHRHWKGCFRPHFKCKYCGHCKF